MEPLVSVITPCYNCENYIEETLLSIKNQTYHNIEHIVVDGKSTDGTLKILEYYKKSIILISEKDEGMYDAINKGMKRAKGEILCYLNADDVFKPKTIEYVVKNYLKTKNDVFLGYCDFINKDSNYIYTYTYPFVMKNICFKLGRMPFAQQSVLWTKKRMDKIGLFNKEFKFTGDLEFFVRLFNTDKISFFRTSFASFRIHDTQLSNQLQNMKNEGIKALKLHNGYFTSVLPPLKFLIFRILYETTQKLMNFKPVLINLMNKYEIKKYF